MQELESAIKSRMQCLLNGLAGITLLVSQQILALFLWLISGFGHSLYSARTYNEGVTEVVDPELMHDRGATAKRSLRQCIIHVRRSDGQLVQNPSLCQSLAAGLRGRRSRHKVGT